MSGAERGTETLVNPRAQRNCRKSRPWQSVTLGVLTILLAARGAREVNQKLLAVSSGEQH